MSLNVTWPGQDRAFVRRLLDAWQTSTGYIAPTVGLVFVEPKLEETGTGTIWCAARPEYTVVGAGVSAREVHPDRSFMVHCHLYFQPGEPEPDAWEAVLIPIVEALLVTLKAEGTWPGYSMSHPIPNPAQLVSGQSSWVTSGLSLRFKV